MYVSLGVEFHLSAVISRGLLTMANTERRKDDLKKLIKGYLKAGRMNNGEASTLVGKTLFASAQTLGRPARVGIRVLKEIEYSPKFWNPLTRRPA